ncbi:MAG TPA: HEAT repeat domain-containing protein [Candidatus Ozemobacteraceae bacterium]|nr:HEAT repeat domain-containing protein [Candidatus Ozemobacteraceae bacterium]
MIWPFSAPKAPQELLLNLSDPDPAVRKSAYAQLEEHEDPATNPLVHDALREAIDGNTELLLPLIGLTGRRGIEDAVDDLAGLLEEGDTGVRIAATQALLRIPTQHSLEQLIPLLTDTDLTIRRDVREGIARVFGEKAMGALVRAVPEDHNSTLYFEIVSLFEDLGLFELLHEQFHHPDPEVRRFHFDTLVRFHRPDFVPLYLEMADEPDAIIRRRLRDALSEYTPDELLPAFREKLLEPFELGLLQLTDDILIRRFPEARKALLDLALAMPSGDGRELLVSRLLKRLDPVLFEPALKLLDADSSRIRSMTADALTALADSVLSKASHHGEERGSSLEAMGESWRRVLYSRITGDETIRPELLGVFFHIARSDPGMLRPVLGKLLSNAFADTVKALSAWPFSDVSDLIRAAMKDDPSIGALLLSGQSKLPSPFLLRVLLKNASVLDPADRSAFFRKQMGSRTFAARLTELLEDEDHDVRAAALEFAGEAGGEQLSKIVEARMRDTAPAVRLAAVRIAQKSRHPRVLALLEESIADPAPEVAAEALRGLKLLLPPERLAPHLTRLVHSPDEELRSFALQEVARMTQKRYLDNFASLSPEVRKLAGAALLKLDASFIEQLIGELKSLDPELRLRAARIMENIQVGNRGREALLGAMKDPSRKVRAAVIKTLGIIGDRELLGNLIEFFNDPDDRVRANAIEAIASVGDSRALQLLLPFLEDTNNRIRANAAIAVWQIGKVNVVPVLQKMLAARDRLMRSSGLWALGEIRQPNSLPIILAHIRDTDEMVRLNAVRAAVKLSPAALKPFLPTLRKDASPEIRKIVTELSYKVL